MQVVLVQAHHPVVTLTLLIPVLVIGNTVLGNNFLLGKNRLIGKTLRIISSSLFLDTLVLWFLDACGLGTMHTVSP